MLKIRLSRIWKNDTPFFRLVLTEHRKSAKSWYIDVLGSYDAVKKIFIVKDVEQIKKFISTGAQLSPRVEKLFKQNNIAL